MARRFWVQAKMIGHFITEPCKPMSNIYEGIDKAPEGAMNPTGNIIRDAWVFGLIPETETCEGWEIGRINALYDDVSKAWEPYGGLPSALPDDLKEKHQLIYLEAIRSAKEKGWNPQDILDNFK